MGEHSVAATNAVPSAANYRARILVVDDVPANVTLLCTALAEDYEVQFATSAKQGLQLAQLRRPDLLLLDVMMPGMSGHEMHRLLRADPQLQDIPVVFVTADTSPESEMEGLDSGAFDYITKPFVLPIVLARVRNLLARSRMQKELEMSLTGAGQGLWDWELDSNNVHFNSNWALPLGFSPGEMQPCQMPWEQIVHPADWPRLARAKEDYLAGRSSSFEPELRLRQKNDRFVWMQIHGSAVDMDPQGRAKRLMGTYMNISRRKQAEIALRDNERRLSLVLEAMQDAVLVIDGSGIITLSHIPDCSPMAFLAQPLTGQPYAAVLPAALTQHLQKALATELSEPLPPNQELDLTQGARKLYLNLNCNRLAAVDEDPTGTLVVIQDISARKAAEEEIRALAFYDALTKLPNRRLLRDRLRMSMNSSARSGNVGALLFIDLDKFKKLNDTQGHDFGDSLLVDVARRLEHCTRNSDTVARIGGDEFVVLLDDLGHTHRDAASLARKLGEKILAALQQHFHLDGQDYSITASIGISLFQGHTESDETLLKHADLAMYSAKSAGRNGLSFFDPEMATAVAEHVDLERAMQSSLQQKHFYLLYQPQVDAAGNTLGVEALVRWQHPQQGFMSPAQFIPVAEECGLIVPLGLQILEMACAQIAEWQQQPELAHLTVSVNISPLQFQQGNFVERVQMAVLKAKIDPRRLKLEITESLLLHGTESVVQRMTQLTDLGVRFALDDFGTGYSSLAYLKQLPLDQIKIDQSFVRNAPLSPVDLAIVRAVVTLGDSLGMSVLAEGVETPQQLDLLAAEDCHHFQGYLFSRPVPAAEIRPRMPRVC